MTVAAMPPIATYQGNGVTTSFAAPFRFKAPADLIVDLLSAFGVPATLLLGVDYAVTGGATDIGGTVTTIAPVPAGVRLRIRRRTPQVQPTVYASGDRFPAKSHEDALDRGILIAQEQQIEVDDTTARAPLAPAGEVMPALPALADRRARLAAFGDAGEIGVLAPVAGAQAVVTLSPTGAPVAMTMAALTGRSTDLTTFDGGFDGLAGSGQDYDGGLDG